TEQLREFNQKSELKRIVVGYCRVSTPSQKDDLETQVENLKTYTDDLVQIITVFANRLYGSRSKKTKRLIDEVKSIDNREKD
ncbi:recombinase family protein, partial [Clostridioides difficile]